MPDATPTTVGDSGSNSSAGGSKRRALLLKSGISIALVAFILSRVNTRQVFEVLLEADLLLLGCAWLLTFVGALLTASRWRILLAAQGVYGSTRHLVACWMTACFFNQFLPSTIGGDAIRIFDSWKLGASKAGAAAAVLLDRLLGLFTLMIFGTVALYLSSLLVVEHPEIRVLVVGAVLVLGLIAAWIFVPSRSVEMAATTLANMMPKPIRRIWGKFNSALAVYRGRGSVLLKALLLSTGLQLNVILFYFLVGMALDFDISFLDYMLIIPVASVVLLLPITINGVGLREGIFVLLLSAFGVDAAAAIAFAWASFSLFLVYGLLGGVVYALRTDPVRSVGNDEAGVPESSHSSP